MVETAEPLPRGADDSRRLIALGGLFLGTMAMGASPIFVRLADVGPYASAFWRMALALPFLWAWMRLEENGRRPDRLSSRAWRAAIFSGLFFAGDLFFWHLSIFGTSVANATFLATLAPVVVFVGAWAFLGEKADRAGVFGLVLCLAGAGALVGSSYAFAPGRLMGDVFGLITACFFGGYFLTIRAARRLNVGTARLSMISAVVTTAALLIAALLLDDRILPSSLAGFGILLGLALISQVGGQGLLAYALGHLPAPFSSLVIFFEAVAAAAFGWLILNEALSALQLVGGGFILAGLYAARPRAQS